MCMACTRFGQLRRWSPGTRHRPLNTAGFAPDARTCPLPISASKSAALLTRLCGVACHGSGARAHGAVQRCVVKATQPRRACSSDGLDRRWCVAAGAAAKLPSLSLSPAESLVDHATLVCLDHLLDGAAAPVAAMQLLARQSFASVAGVCLLSLRAPSTVNASAVSAAGGIVVATAGMACKQLASGLLVCARLAAAQQTMMLQRVEMEMVREGERR